MKIVELERKEKIETIVTRLDSIIEILVTLQMIDMNLAEFASIDIPDFLEVPIETLAEIRQQIEDL